MTPHDPGQAAHPHGVHESPWIMLVPLVILAILSVIGGWVGIPAPSAATIEIEHSSSPSSPPRRRTADTPPARSLELGLAAVSVLVALARLLRRVPPLLPQARHRRRARRSASAPLYTLLSNKYWVDEFYHAVIVTPLLMFTRGIVELIFERRPWSTAPARASAMTVRGLGCGHAHADLRQHPLLRRLARRSAPPSSSPS